MKMEWWIIGVGGSPSKVPGDCGALKDCHRAVDNFLPGQGVIT
jgi:hypothetical protein